MRRSVKDRSIDVARCSSLERLAVTVVVAVGVFVGALSAQGSASAEPVQAPDPGVPFSSVVYGTGCTYWLTGLVNSRGTVTFWEGRKGYTPQLIGSAEPSGGQATVRWIPRRTGDRYLYTKQNGARSTLTLARVHQGYGSGGMCIAL
ncbi:hypothetical protein LK459_05520 [Gordonia otitidis]|nr:hypothetical protein [Gordonia otitidis]UEA60321.1 hypothetical protein LK459_05520 [Gordonia otitidis]